jgi:hypothetical protein
VLFRLLCRALPNQVLRQKEASDKAFDEKLAKLGYSENHTGKRSHHKAPVSERTDGKLSAKVAISSTPAA